jgi:GNAT superfamily N-acetyltransferase
MNIPFPCDSDDQVLRCHAVMAELRPQVARADFLAQVRQMQAYGYRLAALEDDGEIVTVAGYRLGLNFHRGHHLYVEDLVTASSARSRGHGDTMLSWLQAQARAAGCDWLELDSGTQRHGAHRFYLRHGFVIPAFRFSRDLGS